MPSRGSRIVTNHAESGLTLDLGNLAAFAVSLQLLAKYDAAGKLRQPVFINADVIKGPGSNMEPVNASMH